MALAVIEHFSSRAENFGHNDGDAELIFHVGCTLSGLAVYEAVIDEASTPAFAPKTFHDLQRGIISITPLGGGWWQAKVKYGNLKTIDVDFDLGGEKVKINKSKQTIKNVNLRDAATKGFIGPSFGGLIGVSKKDKTDGVEGVDIYAPGTYKLKINYSSEWEDLPADYIATCKSLEGKVNDSELILQYKEQTVFIPRGELLFISATLKDTNNKGCGMNFNFAGIEAEEISIGDADGSIVDTNTATITAGNPNIILGEGDRLNLYQPGMIVTGEGIPSGAVVTGTDNDMEPLVTISPAPTATAADVGITLSRPLLYKEGHWYVWLRTVETEQTSISGQKYKVHLPSSAHIERVYNYGDFAPLNLFSVISIQEQRIETELSDDLEEEEDDDIFDGFQGFTTG